MKTLTDQQLEELRRKFSQEPHYKKATEALSRLLALGCDLGVIQGYIGRAASYKYKNMGVVMRKPKAHVTARKVREFSKQLEKLAKQGAEIRRTWGFGSRLIEAGCMHIPEELQKMAWRYSRVRVKGYTSWYPGREAVLDLLDHIHSSTGRYHYAEVSLLINTEATWRALKRGQDSPEVIFEVDSLKMLVQRWKREQAAKLKGSTEKKEEFHPKPLDPYVSSDADLFRVEPGQPIG